MNFIVFLIIGISLVILGTLCRTLAWICNRNAEYQIWNEKRNSRKYFNIIHDVFSCSGLILLILCVSFISFKRFLKLALIFYYIGTAFVFLVLLLEIYQAIIFFKCKRT